jgi:flagellar basal-body rod modification protein FlgD
MAISTVSSTDQSSGLRSLTDLKTSETKASQQLDKNAFLKLLVAQLSNQDPLQPSNDTEYIAQLAQFSSLEQMESLNSATTTSQAYSLLGKYVYVDAQGTGQNCIFGKVDGAGSLDGKQYVIVDGKQYDLSSVVAVVNSADADLEKELMQCAQLIGKTITAQITDDAGNTSTVTGQVTRIVVKDHAVYAVVNENEISLSDIQQIES